jgi:hypothetical protein
MCCAASLGEVQSVNYRRGHKTESQRAIYLVWSCWPCLNSEQPFLAPTCVQFIKNGGAND